MQPKIEIIGDANKCLPYLKWAKNQWALREGSWQKQLDTCIIYFKRNADYGYILFQTFGTKGLVTNPHNATNLQFVLDATKDPLWIMDRDGWPPLEPNNPDQDKEIQVGNYYVLDKDDNAYSIKVPHHNLASDISSSVKGYTQYSWTTNVSMEDVYTCYSEYVYSEGEAVFAGTMAPPEADSKYSLIVGLGIDDQDTVHIAQLVQIPQDYGYWRIEKDGVTVGTFFGTLAQAAEKGAAILVWKNESAEKRWFIEFLTCNNGLDSELVTNLNIYRREDAGRYDNKQWFYKDGEWSQYTSSLPAKLKFDGLQYEGSLKKTKYSQVLDAELVNSKPVVANHVATSLSGVIGTHSEITLPIKKIASVSVGFTASPTWPADDSFYTVTITKDDCVDDVRISCTLPNTTISEIVAGSEYRVTLSNRCVPNQSAQLVSGVITVSSSYMPTPATASLSYTSKTGSWGNSVLTWQSPSISCSEILVDDIVSGATRTLLYRCSSVYPSYQESIGLCMTPWGYQIACTNDEGSFTREPEYLLPATFAYTVSATKLPACAPNCQPSNETMARNFWYIPTRQETYEWICT